MYFDTDSVIYLEEPDQPSPVLGDYLGEFTSELETDDYIEEFVLGGPKNYGYKTKKGKVECKVRGFQLNSEGKTQLNYDVMRQNILDEIQHPQKEPRWCMIRQSSIPVPFKPTLTDAKLHIDLMAAEPNSWKKTEQYGTPLTTRTQAPPPRT